MALTDPALPVERRIAVVEELSGGKALQTERRARRRSSSRPAGSASCRRSSTGSSSWRRREREREVAEVRSAIPLDDAEQIDRLARGARPRDRQDVEVKVDRRPDRARRHRRPVGDIVIDGTVRHRLEQLKEQI